MLIDAPLLLAEGASLTGLGRRLTSQPSAHWTSAALCRTIIPSVVVTVYFGIVGFALEQVVPGATTMGEAMRMAWQRAR